MTRRSTVGGYLADLLLWRNNSSEQFEAGGWEPRFDNRIIQVIFRETVSMRGDFFDWKDGSDGTPSGVNFAYAIVKISGVLDPGARERVSVY